MTIRQFFYFLFHRRARRLYRQIKKYPGSPKDIIDPLKKPKQKTELQKLAHEILNEKTKLFDNFKKIKKGKP